MVLLFRVVAPLLFAAAAAGAAAGDKYSPSVPQLAVANLRVEYFHDPLAVATQTPRFSWELPAGLDRGVRQMSYQITVVRLHSDFAPLWSSGVVDSNATHGIVCNHTLPANTRYQAIVRWMATSDGSLSAPAVANFGVGPMEAKDWGGAHWIGSEGQRQIRGSFTLNATLNVEFAVLHVAAPGCSVVTVNGKLVDSGVGICTWTQFQHTVLYSTLDVGGALVPGENVIGLLLGHSVFGDR
jgi:alpha-L-rhamnosidase